MSKLYNGLKTRHAVLLAMEVCYINLKNLLDIQTSLIFSNVLLTVSKSRVYFKHYAADGNLGFSIGKSENSGFFRNYCSQ